MPLLLGRSGWGAEVGMKAETPLAALQALGEAATQANRIFARWYVESWLPAARASNDGVAQLAEALPPTLVNTRRDEGGA